MTEPRGANFIILVIPEPGRSHSRHQWLPYLHITTRREAVGENTMVYVEGRRTGGCREGAGRSGEGLDKVEYEGRVDADLEVGDLSTPVNRTRWRVVRAVLEVS